MVISAFVWGDDLLQLEAIELLGESGAPAVHVDVHAVVLGSPLLVSSCTAPEESPGLPTAGTGESCQHP